uniref:8.9 kDa family member n=1 Tax=Rhipicephalus appendiculatus TaxID=34631 RepID=A0A131Z4T6_RHIAP
MMISALAILFSAWAALVLCQYYDPRCPVRNHPIGCQFMGRLLFPDTSQLWRLPCLIVSCAVDGSVTTQGCPRTTGRNPHPGAAPGPGVWPHCCDMCS